MKRIILVAAFLLIFVVSAMWAAGDANAKRFIMRFPDVHKDTVVFVYGEDLWKAPVQGGTAVRLTLHDGLERFPKFSPDGKLIAFTGNYDGNADVYVMNADGGEITRVTYHYGADDVVGWHPVKNKIIFRSTRSSFNRFFRLFLISPDGTGLETLILNEAAAGSFSPDANKIAYNKVRREHRTWKRYTGGLAQEIYMYDFKTNTDVNLTKFEGTDRTPMWIGDTVYFSSDRNYTLNIFAYDTKTGKTEQVTSHDYYDVRRPSKGINSIVYELGGELWRLDTETKKTAKIAVKIRADAPETRPYLKDVKNYITGFNPSPSGNRVLVTARGEVFSVPKKDGPTRNLTADSGARDKDAAWSPDGKRVAYLSDKSGEYEIYLVDPMGKTEAVKLTGHKDGYRHTLRWSPDSKKIAFADQTLRCYYLDTVTKKITEVDKADYENVDVSLDVKAIYDFAWSPDSRYIAYSKMDADLVNKVYIYALETGKARCVSSGLFNEFHPVFSNDGEHLLFVSNRRFNPTLCDFEWEMVYKDMAGIYCLTLRKDGKPLLPFLSDEEDGESAADKKKKDKEEEDKPKKKVHVKIDFDGLAGRIEALPLPRGNYRCLAVNDDAIFYLNGSNGDYNRFEFRRLGPQDLKMFDLEDREEKTVITKIDGYKLSFDGTHAVCRKGGEIGLIDLEDVSGEEEAEMKSMDLEGLKMHFDPRKEWLQIYNESWRLERDFYYEPGMRGHDWKAMGEKYRKLVPFASCRQDLRFIIGELIGELNTSHTYVNGGDVKRRAQRVNIGMLGVDWKMDAGNKRYKFGKIYRVPDWSRGIIPPLSGPGLHIKEGDYLLAVNGEPVTTGRNIFSYFQGLAGKQVTLLINSKPGKVGATEYTVKPLNGEYRLRYLDWVERNRLTVEKESNGEIGYIHFPDTYLGSAIEFPKYFYSQLSKKGIIVDGRFNGGGLDPDIFLHRLNKTLHSYWTRRYSGHQASPSTASNAHMACLTNRQAGSGGDELPYLFRHKGMGPVIGTRTWGGLVGVSMFIPMIDGGGLSAPDYRVYDEKGEWVVENVGVTPDIIVDLHPAEMARGYDAQLMKAIEVLKKKIKEE
ncbi:MAG: peptidase S41, partial [bacterium]|nr:peptidase S41 [bacterium]